MLYDYIWVTKIDLWDLNIQAEKWWRSQETIHFVDIHVYTCICDDEREQWITFSKIDAVINGQANTSFLFLTLAQCTHCTVWIGRNEGHARRKKNDVDEMLFRRKQLEKFFKKLSRKNASSRKRFMCILACWVLTKHRRDMSREIYSFLYRSVSTFLYLIV